MKSFIAMVAAGIVRGLLGWLETFLAKQEAIRAAERRGRDNVLTEIRDANRKAEERMARVPRADRRSVVKRLRDGSF